MGYDWVLDMLALGLALVANLIKTVNLPTTSVFSVWQFQRESLCAVGCGTPCWRGNSSLNSSWVFTVESPFFAAYGEGCGEPEKNRGMTNCRQVFSLSFKEHVDPCFEDRRGKHSSFQYFFCFLLFLDNHEGLVGGFVQCPQITSSGLGDSWRSGGGAWGWRNLGRWGNSVGTGRHLLQGNWSLWSRNWLLDWEYLQVPLMLPLDRRVPGHHVISTEKHVFLGNKVTPVPGSAPPPSHLYGHPWLE